MYSRKLAVAAVSAFVMAAGVGSGFAQTSNGALVGVVRDSTGAVIPKATVSATNTATGVAYNGSAGAAGEYRISNIPNGTYDVMISTPGFAPSTLKGVGIVANSVQTQDFTLAAAGTSSVVEVTNQAAVAIDTTTAQIETVFSSKETVDLPTSAVGNGVLNLSLLAPGVASTGGLGAGRGPSVGGQRPRNNNFMIDGVDNNSKGVTGPELFVPNDAIQQFTLLQNVYSAQYGHSTGGQFNSLIVSGTNTLHGTFYEYDNNRNLNAVSAVQGRANRAANTATNPVSGHFQPRYDFNRYGGQLGGPVLKNKLFLFSNFERQTTGQVGVSTAFCSPTAAGFTALGTIAYGGGPQSAINLGQYQKYSPVASTQSVAQGTGTVDGACNAPFLNVRNGAGVATQVAVGPVSVSNPLFTNYYFSTSSLDYTIGQHDSLRARYLYNRTDSTDTAATFPAFFGPAPARFHLGSISEVHTFSANLSNELRLGYNRQSSQTPVPPVSFPGLAQFPNLVFVDLNNVNLGPDPNGPQATVQNLYQLVDSITYVKGKHTIAIGAEGRKYISPQIFVQRLRGDYEYKTLDRYLNDSSPDSLGSRNATPPGVSPTYYGDQASIYAYANDDWRVTPTLTFNIGVRYEFTSLPKSEKLQSLNNLASVAGLINFTEPQPQYKNFAPRVGINYAPNANTSIRAAFGINYDVLYDNLGLLTAPPQFQTTENVDTNTLTPNFLASGGLPANVTFASLAAQKAATTALVPDQKLPYSEQWTLGIQHVFHNDYTAEIRYVGTRGVHLDVQTQLNTISPVTAANQLPTSFGGTTLASNNGSTLAALTAKQASGAPYYRNSAYFTAGFTGNITSYQPFGGSNYNGLATSLTRRFQKGLSIISAYTFSRNMDDSTADVNSTALNPRRAQDFANNRAEYSVSALDRRHRFTIAGVYDLPFFKNSNFLLKNILGNFEIAPSYTFQSPQLTTVQSASDSNLNNDNAGDRVFINPNGVPGTGTGVVAVTNGSSCPVGTTTFGVVTGFGGRLGASCAANTIGYTAGTINAATNSFTPSNAYYVQGGSGTMPTAARNTLPTGRTNNLDMSIYKRISFHDRYKVELGAQGLNVLNHSQYFPGSPSDVGSFSSTGVRAFDTVTSASFNRKDVVFNNNARTIQLSGKISF